MLGKNGSLLSSTGAQQYSFFVTHFGLLLCFSFLPFFLASAPNQLIDVNAKHHSELSDDDPLYDSVASDEDYVTAEQLAKCLKVAVCIRNFLFRTCLLTPCLLFVLYLILIP